jgi:hypothetical protein
MNDGERFTKQMEQTLEALRDAIQKLDVPLAQKDPLSGLVRELRLGAYQAGRAERKDTHTSRQSRSPSFASTCVRFIMGEFPGSIEFAR